MTLQEGKEQFVQTWGALGSKWGINRTMAQVHALLLVSPEAMTASEVKEALEISMGNANMNLRALIDWGLIRKENKLGHRKEYYYAEKDIWKITQQIIAERKKRELAPIQSVLSELQQIEGEGEDVDAFKKMIGDLTEFSSVADKTLDTIANSDKNWIVNSFVKLLVNKK
ncbi:MAG: helix-turn-helix domain-containing protein [Chitinophagales bacterium]